LAFHVRTGPLALWILIGPLALWVSIGPLAFWVAYVLAILAFRCISCERGVLGKYSTYRHCFPVRLSLGGCSFQVGRTSIPFPRAALHAGRRMGLDVGRIARHVDQRRVTARSVRHDATSVAHKITIAQRHQRLGRCGFSFNHLRPVCERVLVWWIWSIILTERSHRALDCL
jgi:hypothetical protein